MCSTPSSGTDNLDSAPETYDCVVVGGGPAGCTTAALVAAEGWRTLLVERERMPRFHIGESLMPETFWTLERLGVLDRLRGGAFVRKQGVQFVTQEGKETKPFHFLMHDPRECSLTYHVERSHFDQVLFENAREKGAECLDGTRVLDVDLGADERRVTLRTANGGERTVRTRVVVDATGLSAMLAGRLGLKQMYDDLRKSAIWTYYRGARRAPEGEAELTTIMHTRSKNTWFWYIPLSNDTVSVGVVGDSDHLLKGRGTPEQVFAEERASCQRLEERLAGAEQCDELRVAKEFSYRTTQQAGEGWVLVGDAYGFLDPIYSSGVFLALRSGEAAADCINEGLEQGDVSGAQLSKWCPDFQAGVDLIAKLVRAFYTRPFSFGAFMSQFPEHQRNLTDLLIGRVFDGAPGRIFEDMDPWIRQLVDEGRTADGRLAEAGAGDPERN